MGKEPYTGNFCHNDMDMLVVGMHGASNDGFIGSKIGGCTDQEYLTHFALWAIMGSPLIMGCDLRKASEETKKTLLNKDLIAINQDLEARGAYMIKPLPDAYNENEAFILLPEYPCLCTTASQGKNWANLPSDLHRLYHPMAVWLCARAL